MAAGKFFFYDRWVQIVHSTAANFMDNTVIAVPLHSGYTPGTHSHSAFAQVSPFRSSASGTVVNGITLSSKAVTFSGDGTFKIDAADLSGFSADGDTFQAKRVVLFSDESADGVTQPLIGFFDVDTGASTGVEGTQLNVTWAAGGIAKVDVN